MAEVDLVCHKHELSGAPPAAGPGPESVGHVGLEARQRLGATHVEDEEDHVRTPVPGAAAACEAAYAAAASGTGDHGEVIMPHTLSLI